MDWGTHSGALAARRVYTLWEEECVILVYFCNCESALKMLHKSLER
jgi:siroheme synthase (precorrin-2 oxidase/ferrochelatase)